MSRTPPLLRRRAEVLHPHLVLFALSFIGGQVILARQRMSPDDVPTVSLSVMSPRVLTILLGERRGNALDGDQELQG